MDGKEIMQIFENYEKSFGEWLYSAWDFESVDWIALAQEAEKCIQQNTAMTDKTKAKFFDQLEQGKVY